MSRAKQRPYEMNHTKVLSESELTELERLLKAYSATREALLIEVALRSGARATELLNVRARDLNADEESILIRGIKGSANRTVPLESALFKRLFAYAQGKDVIFDFSYSRLVQLWNGFRPCKKTFHCLRHTFAMNVYRKTRDLRLLQSALGHREIKNTLVYADFTYSTTEMRRLIL